MLPGRATIDAADTFLAAPGVLPPPPAPVLPAANPALGDSMRNRNWEQREAAAYYEMRAAPQPWQFTRDRPHPTFGGGSGTPLTQFSGPGPRAGFQRPPTVYGDVGRPGASAALVRPSYAYNGRLVGAGRNPLNYAVGTWPNMYYPGGSNTYTPSWEATGLIIKYTRDPSFFRINKYGKELNVPKDTGYYLALSGDDPYRVVNTNDFLWADSADAPGGRDQRQGFGFQPYRTARYCFPFSLGALSVVQADWPILAEHAGMQATKAMTVRTMLAQQLLCTAANWTGPWGTNTGAVSGAWSTSDTSTRRIQVDLNGALITVEQATGGIVADEDALSLVINPTLGRGVAASLEMRDYIKGSPDALAAITDYRNPNRKYGLAPYLYGLSLVVENAVVVTTPKSGNVASPPSQARSYVWPTANPLICSKPRGIVAPEEQTLDFSTFAFRFLEQMKTEQKSDPDNRREIGRVVENYTVSIQAPQTGFLFTGAS
jgi:hypothetical protein